MKIHRKIDASALAKSSCQLRLKYITVDGFRIPLLYNDTQYGVAGHDFLAKMALTRGDFQAAVTSATKIFDKPCVIRRKKEHLTKNHFIKTCFDYWEHITKTDDMELILVDNVPLVEQKFCIPVYEDDELIIDLCGTIDKTVKNKNGGIVAIGDYKFTSSWDIESYFKQHRLSPQLKVYRWALYRLAAMSPEGSILRQITKNPIGMFIDGVFIKSGKETTFQRSDIWIPKQDEVDEFDRVLDLSIRRFASLCKMQDYNIRDGMINGSCSNAYGSSSANGALCQFYDVCAAHNRDASQHVLKNNFIIADYDPLTFGEGL